MCRPLYRWSSQCFDFFVQVAAFFFRRESYDDPPTCSRAEASAAGKHQQNTKSNGPDTDDLARFESLTKERLDDIGCPSITS